MRLPLEIRARGLDLAGPLRATIEERARKLDQFYRRIIGCRVFLEGPGKHHRRGRLSVRIDLTVPGKEIVITRQAGVDLDKTVLEAFNAAGRRIEDHIRKARGHVKHHEPPRVGRVLRLFPDRGYGFLESPDGLEIYFHRNSVQGLRFSRLRPGTPVRYATAEGEKGPQATLVRRLRRAMP